MLGMGGGIEFSVLRGGGFIKASHDYIKSSEFFLIKNSTFNVLKYHTCQHLIG